MKVSIAGIVAAAAALASSSPIIKREVGGILMCTGANATGTCEHKVYKLDTCHQLKKPFLENVKTFAPDGEDFRCFPRLSDCGGICTSPTGCTFGAVTFDYENKYNLSAIQWDNLFRSFDCVLNEEEK